MSGTANPRKQMSMNKTNTHSGDSAVSRIRPTGMRPPWNAQIALTRSSFKTVEIATLLKNLLTRSYFKNRSIRAHASGFVPGGYYDRWGCPETRDNFFVALSLRTLRFSRWYAVPSLGIDCGRKNFGGIFMVTLLRVYVTLPGEKVRFLDVFWLDLEQYFEVWYEEESKVS